MITVNLKTTNTLLQAAVVLASAAASPIKLIIDTDAGFDVDDVGAISVANALQDNGEVEIVAVGHTNGLVRAPRCALKFNENSRPFAQVIRWVHSFVVGACQQ
jgi:hypothetical protein